MFLKDLIIAFKTVSDQKLLFFFIFSPKNCFDLTLRFLFDAEWLEKSHRASPKSDLRHEKKSLIFVQH